MTKIKKILIANRGEIAVRVMKTCRKMGIGSVAVYSDADRKALHVRMADEAVHIGASPAAESYLVIDKIIEACKSSGADAVHPGYGFLSENPKFARRLKKEGITFIGPSPESMEAMGLKDAAKKLMEKAGVPVTPGYHGKDQDAKLLKAKAGMIGYPVLIKAIAGGGGKGMRKVERADDFADALASCMREAKSAFGDDRVLIEKYILSPRHIEVQVFGDTHGNIVHMFERDCSLQRRHQKVIEEAPAPGMTDTVRKAMTDAACEAAQAVNYVGAGTVEFIVDGSGKLRKDGFWFMEMNTRLQVEHPVTEMITGLDLVELQIKVAQGEKLPKQGEIKMEGHAIEARLYAEDPRNEFLPSIGKIISIDTENWSNEEGGFRVDTGVEANDGVSIYYDPMIAKVIGYGDTRYIANVNLRFGICDIEVVGLNTNSHFLVNCVDKQAFRDGNISTGFIQERPELVGTDIRSKPELFALAALVLKKKNSNNNHSLSFPHCGWRLNQAARNIQYFTLDGKNKKVEILKITSSYATVSVDDKPPFKVYLTAGLKLRGGDLSIDSLYDPIPALIYYGEWEIFIREDYIYFLRNGAYAKVERYNPEANAETATGGNTLTAPMPGKIIAANVKPGDAVKSGDKLIIMEAMKMEMSLEAPRDGVVAAVNCAADALVADGDVLLELETERKE